MHNDIEAWAFSYFVLFVVLFVFLLIVSNSKCLFIAITLPAPVYFSEQWLVRHRMSVIAVMWAVDNFPSLLSNMQPAHTRDTAFACKERPPVQHETLCTLHILNVRGGGLTWRAKSQSSSSHLAFRSFVPSSVTPQQNFTHSRTDKI